MTVEVKIEAAPAAEHPPTAAEGKCDIEELKPAVMEKSSSYREESNLPSDLKDHEKKALVELKTKVEEAIAGNTLFEKKPSAEENPPNSECAETQETGGGDVSIWGVPLLPSAGNPKTDVVLLKFLRARDFKINDAFEMLRKTLSWRKEFKVDSILDEDLGADFASAGYMSGADRRGHPICYNIFGVLENEALATEEKREQFMRWRVQLMEKGAQKLDFASEGVNSLLQINDLGNYSGPPKKKDVRVAVDKTVAILQDNYPEFVAKNIFINVPFWHFAFHSMLTPFLTQRSRSKLVFARPSMVTETLLKYIPIQEIPIKYGGIKRENDFEFSGSDDEPTEVVIKAGSTETIEIATPECGTTFIWDLIVLGWEVNYTEEFVPKDESSYTMVIQKGKKMGADEAPVRKTFKNQEDGKVVVTVQNCSGKKKRLFYRYKVKKASW